MKRTYGKFTDGLSEIGYQILIPDDYDAHSIQKYPTILFLHGTGRRGTDLSILDEYGINRYCEMIKDMKFIVITPQCRKDSSWNEEKELVIQMLKQLRAIFPIDENRVYLSGFSMGGNGTWEIAVTEPDIFAAIAPIAGWYEGRDINKLYDMPIWNFHGEDDEVVSISGSETIMSQLSTSKSDVKFSRYKHVKHDVMYKVLERRELYEWLLTHRKNRK